MAFRPTRYRRRDASRDGSIDATSLPTQVFGKYCAHFHEHGECADGDCIFEGNAVEGGVQRGLIVHNTHLATVSHNVFHAVRGPALYVQDGLETYNRFMYNVALCHRTRDDDGCTIQTARPSTRIRGSEGLLRRAARL